MEKSGGLYMALKHAHSGLRWVVLILLVAAIAQAFSKKNTLLDNGNRKLAMFAMISVHIQLLIGLVLYFISPLVVFGETTMSDTITRFYTVEHLVGMLIAIALITVGHSKAKKSGSFKPVLTFYGIALVLILASIPWPFRNLGGSWF